MDYTEIVINCVFYMSKQDGGLAKKLPLIAALLLMAIIFTFAYLQRGNNSQNMPQPLSPEKVFVPDKNVTPVSDTELDKRLNDINKAAPELDSSTQDTPISDI